MLVLAMLNLVMVPFMKTAQIEDANYSTFVKETNNDNVKEVQEQSNQILYMLKDSKTVYRTGKFNDPDLMTRLEEHNVDFTAEIVEETSPFLQFLIGWIIPIFFATLLLRSMMSRGSKGGGMPMGGNMFGMGKSNARVYDKNKQSIRFNDVAGEDEAKESIYNSQFSSTNNSLLQNETMKNGIGMNRSDDGNDCSRIDICNSILSTMIDDGSMFYIDGQDANIVLNKSLLSFDCDHVDLLHVSNGNVKLTGSEETMVGNITAADHARADVYLLDGSSYTGSTSYENQGTLNMNISSDSSWIVSSDSKVNCLNIESGGEIIDEDGNLVTITQQGKTIISGTSPYSVTVDERVGSSFDTNSDNVLCTSYMDRTNFDHTYQVSTAFSTNTASLQVEKDTNDDTIQDNSMKYVLVTLATIGVISFVSYVICKKNKHADM